MLFQEIKKRFQHYFANLILIWLIILLYKTSSYYLNFLRTETQLTLALIALAYTLFGFIYYTIIPLKKIKKTKATILFEALIKIIKKVYYFIKFKKSKRPSIKIEKQEKITFLFVLVKIFFLPIMLNFFFQNGYTLINQINNITDLKLLFSINGFNLILFPTILTTIFLTDVLWFSFGYAVESGFLKNKIRSVEPTILGWVVALICYPPFNRMFTKYINWFANDYVFFFTDTTTFIMRLAIILFLLIYVSATFALGTKCSNLTNRGIVTRGAYSVVRHPAYISKNLAWWITIIPIISWPAILSMTIWSFIYHLRTITEEKHLSKDLDYVKYCKKVRYRYIPYIY